MNHKKSGLLSGCRADLTRQGIFSLRDLRNIILPLIFEQLLAITIGMADSAMVTRVSEAALAGVALVDSINVVLVQLFSALATGGAVVASQYLGKGTIEKARDAARQLYVLCFLAAGAITVAVIWLRLPILRTIYGQIEPNVMRNAQIYFLLTALSYPFLAIYNSGAALYHSMGKTNVTLIISALMNVINLTGNAITIYGMGMGAAGAGLATLISRMASGIAITLLLRGRQNALCVRSYSFRLERDMVGRILRIGVPNGLEGGMFSFGKLLVASLVSSLGTMAIAANAIGNNYAIMENITGMSINLAIISVVSRVIGAGQKAEARRYTRIMLGITYISNFIINIPIMLFAKPLVEIVGLDAAGVPDAVWIIVFHGVWTLFTWPTSFALPNSLRAAGDVKYTMIVSAASMWIFRVLLSYVLAWCGLGLKAVWIAMITDWAVRSIFFVARYRGERWLEKKVV